MIQSNHEHLLATQQHHMKGTIHACNIFIDCATQLYNMQSHLMKAWLADLEQRGKHMTEMKDMHDLSSANHSAIQSTVEKTVCCGKESYGVVREAHTQMCSVAEEHISAFSRSCAHFLDTMGKSAPSGSEAFLTIGRQIVSAAGNACDSISRTAKQCMELAEANFHAATQAAAKAASAGSAATDRAARCADTPDSCAPNTTASTTPAAEHSPVHHRKAK